MKIRLTVACLALAFAATAQARPLTPAEQRDHAYTARLPLCDDPAVLDKIRLRFHDREVEYWKSGLEIETYDRMREIGWRSWGLDHIPRRYCMARAYLNDGHRRQVSYVIGEGLEMIGWSWGVEWCVHGLDRNNAFAPACKMARP